MSKLAISVTQRRTCKVTLDREQFDKLLERYTARLRHMTINDAQTLAAVELRDLLTPDCNVDLDVRANGVKLEPEELKVPRASVDPLPHG